MPGIGIEEVARRIQDAHPSADKLLSVYERAMEAAREFVKKKEARLVSIEGRIARRADAGISPPRNPFRGLSISFAERS